MKKGGGEWILCHRMPPIWHSLLPVKMSDDQFTEREVYFSLNGTTNVNLVVQMIFLTSQPFYKMLAVLISSVRRKVTKLCYGKYLVLLSNHNVIGRNYLTGVKKWFKTVKPGCYLSFEKRTAGFGCLEWSPSKTYCD